VLSIIAIAATVVISGATLFFYGLYRNVYDSIHHVDVTNQMLGKRPPNLSPGSLNILVIGSDSRAGTHGTYGHISGARSDTSMLLHISPNHQYVTVISFPRDSMVPVLACSSDGQGHSGQTAQPGMVQRLNGTFSAGGAPCLWKTLEQTTHIRIDHFVEVDFNSFKQIVNDIGGVSVCLPFAIKDPASKLNLSKGIHVVDGAQALAFVRERHIGQGSDLQRIQRQQYFLAAAAQKIKQSGLLTNPLRMYSLAHDLAKALTTDITNPTTLVAIANAMKGLSTSALHLISVPVVPYPGDPGAEVQWAPEANKLFSAIARDNKILNAEKIASKSANKAASPAPSATVSPGQVQLQVLNGTSVAGLASTTATGLTSKGFKVTGTGNAPSSYSTSLIEYGSAAQLPAVNTLKNEIAGVKVRQVSGLSSNSLTLILGSGFKGLGAPKAHKSKSSAPNLGNFGGISGNANVCKDSAAFAGPDNPSMFAP